MDSFFVNEDILADYLLGKCEIYCGKRLLKFGKYSCLRYDGRYRSPSTKPHGASSQQAASFTHTHTHTAGETAKISMKNAGVQQYCIQKFS